MNKNLHDIDNLFKKAYDDYTAKPSNEVWEKLAAGLDKHDAEKYKRKFIEWRITAVLLFLLCGFLLLYKSSVTEKTNNNVVSKNDAENIQNSQQNINVNEHNAVDIADTKKTYDKSKYVDTKNDATVKTNNANNISNNAKTSTAIVAKKNNHTDETIKKISAYTQPDMQSAFLKNNMQNKSSINNAGAAQDILHHTIKTDIQAVAQPDKINTAYSDILFADKQQLNKSVQYSDAYNNTIKLKKPKHWWYITAYSYNNWSGYKIDNDSYQNNGSHRDDKDDIFRRENHEGAYTLGLNITRQFNKWNIVSGLQYSAMKIGIASQEIYASRKSNGDIAYKYVTSSGYLYVDSKFSNAPAVGDSIQSEEATHRLQIFSVPAMLGYTIEKGKFSIIPSAGVAANFIADARLKTALKNAGNSQNLSANKLSGMHHFYFDFVANVALSFKVTDKWSVSVIPSMRYAITPVTKNNDVKTFPYNVGLGAGISYRF
jgi:hypothetical protein